MNDTLLIRNARIVNEGQITEGHVLIRHGRIDRILTDSIITTSRSIDARGLYLLPGVIDDQVHFREPGLTHKADIGTESRACAAGGVTSYMEMPNTQPPTFTHELLEQKYARAAQTSAVNYSFYLGASNDNLDEIKRVNPLHVCGVKVFMGSSTGNLLVDDPLTLEEIFAHSPTLVATHCEDEPTVRARTDQYRHQYGEDAPARIHAEIRNHEACYLSSSLAVSLARRHNTRLHVLHISTARELELFSPEPLGPGKRITAEACVHHLWFTDAEYETLGNRIKWNPAVKTLADREAIRAAVRSGRIDVIATDHAPHTIEEKSHPYFKAPSGGPLVQHGLLALLDLYKQGVFSLEEIVQKMCHGPATLFQIQERGYIRPGYWADLVLVDLERPYTVSPQNILYKCGWSPFEGHSFGSTVHTTIVNGQVVYENGMVDSGIHGQRLAFDR